MQVKQAVTFALKTEQNSGKRERAGRVDINTGRSTDADIRAADICQAQHTGWLVHVLTSLEREKN